MCFLLGCENLHPAFNEIKICWSMIGMEPNSRPGLQSCNQIIRQKLKPGCQHLLLPQAHKLQR